MLTKLDEKEEGGSDETVVDKTDDERDNSFVKSDEVSSALGDKLVGSDVDFDSYGHQNLALETLPILGGNSLSLITARDCEFTSSNGGILTLTSKTIRLDITYTGLRDYLLLSQGHLYNPGLEFW